MTAQRRRPDLNIWNRMLPHHPKRYCSLSPRLLAHLLVTCLVLLMYPSQNSARDPCTFYCNKFPNAAGAPYKLECRDVGDFAVIECSLDCADCFKKTQDKKICNPSGYTSVFHCPGTLTTTTTKKTTTTTTTKKPTTTTTKKPTTTTTTKKPTTTTTTKKPTTTTTTKKPTTTTTTKKPTTTTKTTTTTSPPTMTVLTTLPSTSTAPPTTTTSTTTKAPTTLTTTKVTTTSTTKAPTTSTTTRATTTRTTTKAPTTSKTTQKATSRTPSTSSPTTTTKKATTKVTATTTSMPSKGCNGTCDAYRGDRGTSRFELHCDLFPTAEEQHSCKEACAQCPRDICDPHGVQIVYHCPATKVKLKNSVIVSVLIALGFAMLAVCLCSTVAFFVIRRRLKKKKQAAEAIIAESLKETARLKRKSGKGRKTLEFSSDTFHDPDAGDEESRVGRPASKSISLSTRSRSISGKTGSSKSIADSEASMASVLDHFKFDDYHHTSDADGTSGSKKKHLKRSKRKSVRSKSEEDSEIV